MCRCKSLKCPHMLDRNSEKIAVSEARHCWGAFHPRLNLVWNAPRGNLAREHFRPPHRPKRTGDPMGRYVGTRFCDHKNGYEGTSFVAYLNLLWRNKFPPLWKIPAFRFQTMEEACGKDCAGELVPTCPYIQLPTAICCPTPRDKTSTSSSSGEQTESLTWQPQSIIDFLL